MAKKKGVIDSAFSAWKKADANNSKKTTSAKKSTSTKTSDSKTTKKVTARAASVAAAAAVGVAASKKMGKGIWIVIVIFFVIGALAGGLVCGMISQNDTFELVGEKSVVINLSNADTYVEEGVKIVSLGRDLSQDVIVEGEIEKDTNGNYIVGTYTITYTVEDFKYGEYSIYRVINVVGGEEFDNEVEYNPE